MEREKIVPFDLEMVQYTALNTVWAAVIWQKTNSTGLQATVASGCLGCWFLYELLLLKLAANWSGNTSPTEGKTTEKHAIAS